MPFLPYRFLKLYREASRSADYAQRANCIGMEFFKFGRDVGWRLLASCRRGLLRTGANGAIWPVSITRYFEFPFVAAHLPKQPGDFLDISSPRLFSLYVAKHGLAKRLTMVNPDLADIIESGVIKDALNLSIECINLDIAALAARPNSFDCIWSISVIEHVSGEYDDMEAIKWIYGALKPGGRLLLTVPVEPEFREDYRDSKIYDIDMKSTDGKYLFQRVYSAPAIHERLLAPIGNPKVSFTWFGEKVRGHYMAYEKRWISEGLDCIVNDPKEIADHWQSYARWEDMPGHGVCGIVIEKPVDAIAGASL